MTKQDSNLDIETVMQGDTDEVSNSEGFFENLESSTNSMIQDDPQPETEQVTQETDSVDTGNVEDKLTDWKQEAETAKKRYSDSTREAQRLMETNAALKKQLEQAGDVAKFKPLIDQLKQDPTAVNALKDHWNGNADPKKQFGEDFVFDAHEAVTNPNSDSAKALKQMIDREADQKVRTRLDAERRKMQSTQLNLRQQQVEEDFKKRQNMSNEDFEAMKQWANSREMTIDDIYYLMNREKANENATQAGKQDMLNQMKAVRDIPTSMSSANSPSDEKDPNAQAWDIIKGMDEGAENLFG